MTITTAMIRHQGSEEFKAYVLEMNGEIKCWANTRQELEELKAIIEG